MLVKDENNAPSAGTSVPTTYTVALKDSTHSGKKTIIINGKEIVS